MASGYPEIAIMLLSDPKIGNHKISGSILWQIGLLIMDEDCE